MNTCEHVDEAAFRSKTSVRWSFQLSNYVLSRSEISEFNGGPRAIQNLCLGIPAHVPPGSFVLTIVPSVSGLRDEQGDVVTRQEVQ